MLSSWRIGRRLLGAAVCTLVAGATMLVATPPANALSLVNLSGTVQVGGAPQAGAAVTFNGTSGSQPVNISTTTDSSGHWVLHPFSGTVGTLSLNDQLVNGSVQLSIGASDQVEDVNFPTEWATGIVHVLDGDGNPVVGVGVLGSTHGSSVTSTGATSDGSPLTWGIAAIPSVAVCTTDVTGTCTYATLLQLTGTLSTTVTDPYGSDASYPTTFTGQTTTTITSDPTSLTIVVDSTHSLVDLSGTVTSGGSPVPGASVTFDGLKATADSLGRYTLHPFPGSSGLLSVVNGASATNLSLTVGTVNQQQDVSLPPLAHVVHLSGTIYLGSVPAGGAVVSLGGISTTADGSGHYSLSPAVGSTGTLNVSYLSNLYFASAPVAVGTVDQNDDVTIPSGPATINVNVVDGSGDPLAGVSVQGQLQGQTSAVLGSTSDGSPMTWGVNFTTAPFTVCTTGPDGTCSFQSVLNLVGTLSVSTSPFGSDSSYPQQLTASSTASTVTDTTSVTLQVPTASVVALSGTVSFNGQVLAGATVSLGGLLATTDAAGHFLLHPFAQTVGTIAVDDGFIHETSPVIVGSQDQTDDLTISDPNAVTLTGTVLLGSASNPDGPGVRVSFDGISAMTDASGNYSFPVLSGVSGTLTTDGLIHTSSPLSIGSSDQTENLVIPTTPTTTQVQTVDGTGNALPNVDIHLSVPSTPSPVTGTTSSGAPLTWWVSGVQGDCTTGSDGRCSYAGLTNIVGTVSASHQLVPGDSSYPTLQASFTGSVPADGSPLTLAFPNVGYVPSAGSATGSVLMAVSGTSTIQGAASAQVSTAQLPTGVSAPVGAISYAVHSVPVGGSIDVYVQLPSGTVPSAIYKLSPNGSLTDVSSLATISGNTVTMHLTDGGLGDADGVANGVIVDPLIPVTGTTGGLHVATLSLPSATPGAVFAPVTLSVAGATPGATFKWKKISLPKGMKLSSTGVLSGTPNKKLLAGPTSVTVQVTETVVTLSGKKKVKTVSTIQTTIPLTIT
jgi:hypothetical protein